MGSQLPVDGIPLKWFTDESGPAFSLFLILAHSLPSELAFGAFAVARLFAHSFATNFVSARFTDSTPQIFGRLAADHTFFFRFTHSVFPSVYNFYLFGIFKNDLEPILRMIFNESTDFHLAVFKIFRRLFAFLEQLRSGIEDHRCQSLARRSKV